MTTTIAIVQLNHNEAKVSNCRRATSKRARRLVWKNMWRKRKSLTRRVLRPPISAAFAATFLPAYDPADWANNYERRAAAQQRERQYTADYYARTSREKEERENREARECFAKGQRKKSA